MLVAPQANLTLVSSAANVISKRPDFGIDIKPLSYGFYFVRITCSLLRKHLYKINLWLFAVMR